MKFLKVLGLAAVAAMALTAFLGAGSASATVLCTTTSTPCGTGWHIDQIEFSAKSGTSGKKYSTSESLEATCTGSSFAANKAVTGSSSTTVTLEVTKANMIWSLCAQTTDTISGGEIEVHTIVGSDNGTVTAKNFAVTVVVGGISCIYGAGTGVDWGTLTGGPDAILDINAVTTKQPGSNFLCPSDSIWKGEYTVTNHNAVYVEPS